MNTLRDENFSYDRIIVKKGDTYNIIYISEIKVIEASGNYVDIITASDKFLQRASIKSIITRLDPKKFFQINRSTIINIDFVKRVRDSAYGNHLVIMDDGEEYSMTRRYRRLLTMTL